MPDELLWEGSPRGGAVVVLAHGAGAPMDSPFMAAFATGLAANGVPTARFEFPYMRRRREEGTKRPPDRAAVLLESWRSIVTLLEAEGISRRAHGHRRQVDGGAHCQHDRRRRRCARPALPWLPFPRPRPSRQPANRAPGSTRHPGPDPSRGPRFPRAQETMSPPIRWPAPSTCGGWRTATTASSRARPWVAPSGTTGMTACRRQQTGCAP